MGFDYIGYKNNSLYRRESLHKPIINKVKLNNKKSAKVEEVEDKDNLRCKKKFEIYFIIKEIK